MVAVVMVPVVVASARKQPCGSGDFFLEMMLSSVREITTCVVR